MKTGVSYFSSRDIRHAAEDLRDISGNGCNYVVHTFSEADMQYYKGSMRKIIEKSAEAGLEVRMDPWGVAGLFGGEAYSYFVAKNLGVRQITSDGRSVPLACPNNPEARQFLKKWVDEVADIGAKSLFWDEPHFYEPHWAGDRDNKTWGCRCLYCQSIFEQRFKYEMPEAYRQDIEEFKEDSLVFFVEELCDYARSKGLKNSVCLLPIQSHLAGKFWDRIAAIGSLDNIGTDPYWIGLKKADEKFDMENYIRGFCRKVSSLARTYGKDCHIWVQNLSIPSGWEKDVEKAVDLIYAEGIRDIAAWSYHGTSSMSGLSCDDPGLVWKVLGESYKRTHERSKGET
ncbi:MAG: hypothetical protein WC512_01050 [Candidatus Omnitrophota bacterium]